MAVHLSGKVRTGYVSVLFEWSVNLDLFNHYWNLAICCLSNGAHNLNERNCAFKKFLCFFPLGIKDPLEFRENC